MEVDKCKLCGRNLEDYEYGKPVRNDDAPFDLDICYSCLKILKKELKALKGE